MPYIKQFLDERKSCVSHYVSCPTTGKSAVIDPSDQVEQYIHQVSAEFTEITHIIDTHIHADHLSGARKLSEMTSAPIFMYESADVNFHFKPFNEGDILQIGKCQSESAIYSGPHQRKYFARVYRSKENYGRRRILGNLHRRYLICRRHRKTRSLWCRDSRGDVQKSESKTAQLRRLCGDLSGTLCRICLRIRHESQNSFDDRF